MIDAIDRKYFLLIDKSNKKPKIKENDITISCPLCREGKSWNKKQRCHLYVKSYLNKPLVHCFNCGFVGSLESFLSQIDKELYEKYMEEKKREKLFSLRKNKINDTKEIRVKKIHKYPPILFNVPKKFMGVYGTPAYDYLEKRGLEDFADMFYYCETNLKFNNEILYTENSIIIPLKYEEKLYGFQARSIDRKRFYTFIPEENSGFKVWNFFDLNKNNTVYVFESVFDALSSGLRMDSITASLGIDYPKNLLNKLKDTVFCLDNPHIDATAKRKLLKLIKKYKACLWGKETNVKDFNELLLVKMDRDKNLVRKFILENIDSGFKGEIKLKLM